MRFLGLDYGRKRIGLAVSDPLGITAQPIGYIERNAKTFSSLRALISEKEVGDIVLGLPLSLKGAETEMTREVQAFGRELERELALPIHFFSERLTTTESEKLLIQANVRREKRKELRDSMAASLLLQGFLQTRKSSWTEEE